MWAPPFRPAKPLFIQTRPREQQPKIRQANPAANPASRRRRITGSFNFTKAAEKNAENLLVIQDTVLAAKNLANWREHERHSDWYSGR